MAFFSQGFALDCAAAREGFGKPGDDDRFLAFQVGQAVVLPSEACSVKSGASAPTSGSERLPINAISTLQPAGPLEAGIKSRARADHRGEREHVSIPPLQFRHRVEIHPQMPAIAVGTAMIAAQAARRFVCSFCSDEMSDRLASSAIVSSSRWVSIISLMRTTWS